jgi:hypothetical protein
MKTFRGRQTVGLAALIMLVVSAWLLLDGHSGQMSAKGGPTTAGQGWKRLMRRGLAQERARKFDPAAAVAATVGVAKSMPPEMRRAVGRVMQEAEPLALQFDDARFVNTTIGVGLWVVQGRGVTCLFQAVTGAVSCSPAPSAEKQGLLLGVYKFDPSAQKRPSNFVVLGVAPDWAKVVRATVGRRRIKILIADNAYGYRAEVPIKVQGLTR